MGFFAMKAAIKAISSHPPKAWIVLGFSLAVTWLAWSVSHGFVVERANERFQFETHDLRAAISKRMRDQELVLQGGVGLFAASENVSREEWRQYTETLALQKNYPGLQGFGFAEFIVPDELDDHTRRIRAEGFPDYSVRPALGRARQAQPMAFSSGRDVEMQHVLARAQLGIERDRRRIAEVGLHEDDAGPSCRCNLL